MEHKIKQQNPKFGIKHYWKYFLVNFKISFKSITEYKTNLYSSIGLVIFWDLAFIITGLVMSNNFFDIIGWDFVDYCLFLLLSYLTYNITNTFDENKWLEELIPNGGLNNYLYIPGNRFFNYFFHIKFNTIIFNIGNLVIFLPIIMIFGSITYDYIYLVGMLFILLTLLNTFLWQFVNSMAFFILKFTNFFSSVYDPAGYTM